MSPVSPVVGLVIALIGALPQGLVAIEQSYQTIRADLGAKDQAALDAVFASTNAKTDTDVAKFDADVLTAIAQAAHAAG